MATWVVPAAQKALDVLREEMRIRLAHEVLGRVGMHETDDELFVDVADISLAGLGDVLGEVWAWYGWKERRKLARAANFDLALFTVVLQGVGQPLRPLGRDRLELDAGTFCHNLRLLKEYDERRAAMRRRREAQRAARLKDSP
jgi:hypothetical protein